MQRIVRTDVLYETLNDGVKKVNAELERVCPPHMANIVAIMRESSDGYLEWWTPLGGQAIALCDLPEEEQEQFIQLIEQRKKALADFADHLDRGKQQWATHIIRIMLELLDFYQAYSVDGQPVMVDWHRYIKEQPEDDAVVTPLAPVAAPGAAVAAAATAPVAATVVRKRRLWPWLLALLLLLLIGAGLLAWWLWLNQGLFSHDVEPQNPALHNTAPLDTKAPTEPVLEDTVRDNIAEAVRARQKSAKKRSLHLVNEHSEPIFNNAMTT